MAYENSDPITNDGVDSHTHMLPSALSPSRASDFTTCPRLFYYKTILKLSSPPTAATLKGNLVHAVIERLYDREPDQRTLTNAYSLIDIEWAKMRGDTLTEPEPVTDDATAARARAAARAAADINTIVAPGSAEETDLFNQTRELIANWFHLEDANAADPTHTAFPDGAVADGREIHIKGTVKGVNIHGFIDRLNSYTKPDGTTGWAICDYKTGRVPGDAWVDKSFFQLKLYAAAFTDTYGVAPDWLRLIYLKSDQRSVGIKQVPVTTIMLNRTSEQLRATWASITKSARTRSWPTKTSKLCEYCYFQPQCPAWNPQLADIPDANIA